MPTLIANGTVITSDATRSADVLVEGERVVAVAPSIDAAGAEVIDAAGMYVIPGGIDAHTHLDMPLGPVSSADDFQTGTIAAACGGTTTILDFATQFRGQSLRRALDDWHEKADGRAVIDYGFHLAVTEVGAGIEQELDAAMAEGVTSFKVYMAYPDSLMLDDGRILRLLQAARDNGALLAVHAENGAAIETLVQQALREGRTTPAWHARTRPAVLEAEAVNRAIALAQVAGAPIYIVHVSSAEAIEAIRVSRERGAAVYAETCPQYLFLSEDLYEGEVEQAAKYVMSPPLRARPGIECLWRALAAGEVQVVATDHCPFTTAQKTAAGDFTKIPNGAPGIETRMVLLHEGGVRAGLLTLQRFVEVTSTAPAKIFGMHPRKGTIEPGSDADIVVFDPRRRLTLSARTHHMRVDYNAYEGFEVVGAPDIVLSRGRVVVRGGEYVGGRPKGKFIRRARREV